MSDTVTLESIVDRIHRGERITVFVAPDVEPRARSLMLPSDTFRRLRVSKMLRPGECVAIADPDSYPLQPRQVPEVPTPADEPRMLCPTCRVHPASFTFDGEERWRASNAWVHDQRYVRGPCAACRGEEPALA